VTVTKDFRCCCRTLCHAGETWKGPDLPICLADF